MRAIPLSSRPHGKKWFVPYRIWRQAFLRRSGLPRDCYDCADTSMILSKTKSPHRSIQFVSHPSTTWPVDTRPWHSEKEETGFCKSAVESVPPPASVPAQVRARRQVGSMACGATASRLAPDDERVRNFCPTSFSLFFSSWRSSFSIKRSIEPYISCVETLP